MVEAICSDVLKRISPTPTERKKVLRLAKRIQRRVKKAAKLFELDSEVRIEGSVAKDTWLSGEADIDIFLMIKEKLEREKFRSLSLKVAKRALEGYSWIERFAEHPYLEAWIEGSRINIVPCYRVKPGEWISSTDRTPFHTRYVKRRLTPQLRDEVRFLKKFMKGIGVYGAEIKVGGFSGYICELLILRYGSFVETLKNARRMRKEVIDLEGHYRGKIREVKMLFKDAAMIVVDPIDKRRNVAATVLREKLDELIAASAYFLKSPSFSFFYPPEVKPISVETISEKLKGRETDLLFIEFGKVEAVPDVLWGQLYKSSRALKTLLSQHEFKVLRSATWSDEKSSNVILFELESLVLPLLKVHEGPPINSKEVEAFLKKHVGAPHTFSGPWIERGRWFVEIERKYNDAAKLLEEKLKDGGRGVGIAGLIAESIRKSHKVKVNEEILDLYLSNVDFAKFLTKFLVGRPSWLAS